MMALMTLFGGCVGSNAPQYLNAEDFPPAYRAPVPELPGKLVGITREYSGGSMNFASEFEAAIRPGKLVRGAYWDLDKQRDGMIEKKDLPITDAQWADAEKAALDLWGVWQEIPEKVLKQPKDPEIIVLDGGDYDRWYLTWETRDGETTKQYYSPQDRRVRTLSALLEEIINPTGREIKWYPAPELSGATYINDKTDMSFQCNWWSLPNGPEDGYRLIVRFEEDGRAVSIYDQTDSAVWEKAKAAFAWLDPEQYKGRTFKDPITLSLYYSDGAQKSLKLDKKTAAAIEPYLRKITLEYEEKK